MGIPINPSRANSKFITINGETLCIKEWCKRLGKSVDHYYYGKAYMGLSEKEAILRPVRRKREARRVRNNKRSN